MPRLWLRRLCATGIVYACTAAVATASWAAGDPAGRADSPARRCFEYAQAADGSYNAVAACDGAFRSTLNRRDRTATFVNRAIVRSARGDYDGALEDLDRAEALKPDLASARVTRGQVYIRMARWRDAESAFSEGIALGPSQPEEAYFGRAVAREGAGDVEGAYADYTAAARIAPDWPAPREQLERFEEQPARRPTAKV
jgi:tetratricopeptide (TPR) repeat protein